MEVGEIEVVGGSELLDRSRPSLRGNGNHEPKYAGCEPGVAQHRAVLASRRSNPACPRKVMRIAGHSRGWQPAARFCASDSSPFRRRSRIHDMAAFPTPRGACPMRAAPSPHPDWAGSRGVLGFVAADPGIRLVLFARAVRRGLAPDAEPGRCGRVCPRISATVSWRRASSPVTRARCARLPRACSRGPRSRVACPLERGTGRRGRAGRVRASLGAARAFRREAAARCAPSSCR